MCLITANKTRKLAEEDVKSYKRVIDDREGFYKALYYDFKYYPSVIYTGEIEEISPDERNITAFDRKGSEFLNNMFEDLNWEARIGTELIAIGPGFHSARDLRRVISDYFREVVVKCTIPKGSEYYEDETGLLVSNVIIINGPVTQEETSGS